MGKTRTLADLTGGAVCTTLFKQVGSFEWVAPSDCTVVIQAVGGGGAGGVIAQDDLDNMEVAVSGGSGGGYSRKKVSLSSGDTISFTIGAGGGSAYVQDNNNFVGNSGSATTVTGPNSLSLTANGGEGGRGRRVTSGVLTFTSQSAGGTASGGDLNVTGTAGTFVSNFTPPFTNDDIYFFPAGSFSSGFDGAITSPQTEYVHHNSVGNSATLYDDPSSIGNILYANISPEKGKMSGQINVSTASYQVVGQDGTLGCGGGATGNISGDGSTGSRTGWSGGGGAGFVAITVVEISI